MIKPCLFAAALAVAAPALAQDETPAPEPVGAQGPLEIIGDVRLLTDHRFRGVSRSDEDPALEAGLMLSHESGLYAGVRGTTLRGTDGWRRRNPAHLDQGDLQLDLYAGWRGNLGGGFDLDAGIVQYVFAGGEGATDHVEPYASLGYLIGPLQLSTGARYAPAQSGTGNEDMLYLFGQADITLPFRPWSFTAHAGRQDWSLYGSYWNWSLAARHQLQLGGLPDAEIGIAYVDTDLPSASGQDAGLVVTLGVRF